MKTLSTIIAARNAAAWLPQCIASVASQRLPAGWRADIRLGVDSCPATLMAVSRIRHPRFHAYYFPEHVGPYVIFNSLACSYPTDVLARFDADDVMLGDYLLSQLNELGSASVPAITQTWSVYVDHDLHPVCARLASGKTTAQDGRRSEASDGQFMMTSSVWQRLGGFQAWRCHGDTEFIRRARWAGASRKVVPAHLYLRRMHSGSLTQADETGYASQIRRYYAQQIRDAHDRYARGAPPERLRPAVARFYPANAMPAETMPRSYSEAAR
ncbi:MAG TPA: glycosyltransferase family A protein [Bryobacteraceae bacterium]|nr:glycosyltransferase family A protein [Bryobacteraceae bacterium]